MKNFLLPSPRVWQNDKQLKTRVLWREESGNTMYLDDTSSSICTFPVSAFVLQEVRLCKQQQHKGVSFLQLHKEGGLSAPGKWRPGGIEEGCNDAGGTALTFLALCIMLGWPTFNSNWCAWQLERALPVWRHWRVCRGLQLAAPEGRRQCPVTPAPHL